MEFRRKPTTVSDIAKSPEGFKISFKELKKAMAKCEISEDKYECKKIMKDLGIEVIGDD